MNAKGTVLNGNRIARAKRGERIISDDINSKTEYINFLFHLFSYIHVLSLIEKDSKIIDLGCGDGYGTAILSEKALNVIGIDIDESIIAHANQKYGEKAKFFVYDGKEIPCECKSIDVVVSFQVIEHVDDVELFLLEVNRVLKSEGIFYVTTPNRLYRLKPNQKPWNIHHKREFDAKTFERILKIVFNDVRVQAVRGSRDIEEIEISRVSKAKFIGSLVFLNFRKKLPKEWKIKIANFVSHFLHSKENTNDNFKVKYDVNDVFLLDRNIDKGLHLFASCRKS